MKNRAYMLLFFLWCVTNLYAQEAHLGWAKGFGKTDEDEGKSIGVDASGNVYSTGFFNGIVDFDPGPGYFNLSSNGNEDIYISKLDNSGNFLWAKKIGGTGYDIGYSILLDSVGNIYVTGCFTNSADFDPNVGHCYLSSHGGTDIFILKLDSNGGFVWAKNFGSSGNDYGRSIALESNKCIYITGDYRGTTDFDPDTSDYNLSSHGTLDVFISKFGLNGNFIWAKSFGGTDFDQCFSIAIGDSGSIYTTGYFIGQVDFDPGPGIYNLGNNSADNIFILKLDSLGNFKWAKSIGGNSAEEGCSLSVDNNGSVYTTGFFIGSVDFNPDPASSFYLVTYNNNPNTFLLKLDKSGNFKWAFKIGGGSRNAGQSIAIDTFSNIYLTGYFLGSNDFDPDTSTYVMSSVLQEDIYVSKYDSSGNFTWAKSFGGTVFDISRAIIIGANESIYLTGSFRGTADFNPDAGNYNLISNGENDVFILKLNQCVETTSTINETYCIKYISPSGNNIFDSSGIFYDTIPNTLGCDSIITINLTIIEVDTSITPMANELTANASGATYQWIVCQNGNTPIPGATNQSFTPSVNGSYAVIVTENGCTDTSSCYTISTIGIEGVEAFSGIKIYPNPANDKLVIDLGTKSHSDWQPRIELINSNGQIVLEKEIDNQQVIEFDLQPLPAGEYFVKLMVGDELLFVKKIVKV